MSYVDGFVVAVPVANKAAYKALAEKFWPLFKEFGALRQVETWQDDVPRGKVNDFFGAVEAKEDEAVLFSWIEWPDKATRDAGGQKMMTDERMADAMKDAPFDGSRMIYGGFQPGLDDGPGGACGYVDGFLIAVARAKKGAYFDMARMASPVFREHGATRVVETWSDDVPHGQKTDFYRAGHAKDDEQIVFSWIEWPDKATRDAGMKASMEDDRMKTPPDGMPFDGKRMIFGGFAPLVDKA